MGLFDMLGDMARDKIDSFNGAADLGYFLTHMTEDEKKDIEQLQKEIFI